MFILGRHPSRAARTLYWAYKLIGVLDKCPTCNIIGVLGPHIESACCDVHVNHLGMHAHPKQSCHHAAALPAPQDRNHRTDMLLSEMACTPKRSQRTPTSSIMGKGAI